METNQTFHNGIVRIYTEFWKSVFAHYRFLSQNANAGQDFLYLVEYMHGCVRSAHAAYRTANANPTRDSIRTLTMRLMTINASLHHARHVYTNAL